MNRTSEQTAAIREELRSTKATRNPFYKQVRQHIRKAKDKYGRSIIQLEKLLLRAPMMAMTDPLAKRIKREMEARNVRRIDLEGEFYRARPVEKGKKFTVKEMTAPPLGWPNEGRFNHSGQNHLYLATNEETCVKEVLDGLPTGGQVCCIKWKLVHPVKNVLDLSYDWKDLGPSASTLLVALNAMHALERRHRNNLNWKPDYVLTRMIMDVAKETGFSGILYNSVRGDGKNVVLFNPKTKLKVTRKPWCVDPSHYTKSRSINEQKGGTKRPRRRSKVKNFRTARRLRKSRT
jgi:RES domain-containing protein